MSYCVILLALRSYCGSRASRGVTTLGGAVDRAPGGGTQEAEGAQDGEWYKGGGELKGKGVAEHI